MFVRPAHIDLFPTFHHESWQLGWCLCRDRENAGLISVKRKLEIMASHKLRGILAVCESRPGMRDSRCSTNT